MPGDRARVAQAYKCNALSDYLQNLRYQLSVRDLTPSLDADQSH